MTWTEARVEKFKALHNEGLSFSQIAAELGGFSHTSDHGRSACIGKANRLGLEARARNPQPRVRVVRETVPYAIRRLEAKRTQALEKALAPEPASAPEIFTTAHLCTIADLTNETCRWPTWDDTTQGEKFYCGTPDADFAVGRVYCGHHAGVAYNPAPERKPRPYHYGERAA